MKRTPNELDADVAAARRMFAEAAEFAVLTGAGISAESGLATFRDSDGLWEKHRVEDVATPEAFEHAPALVWRFYNARRRSAGGVKPNAGHLALARLEGLGKRVHILTQNVDGLHQRAGSTKVTELHGSLWRVRCTGCGARSADHPVELSVPPRCVGCGALLRPDIVWFGEVLDPESIDAAARALEACDVFLAVGTSAQVQPAASFAFRAAALGKSVIEVNKEPTPLSRAATISLLGRAGDLLPLIIAA